jgi:peptide/nickel transport system substrate-binding protein
LPLLELRFFTVHAAGLEGVVEQGDHAYSSLKNAWFSDKPLGN